MTYMELVAWEFAVPSILGTFLLLIALGRAWEVIPQTMVLPLGVVMMSPSVIITFNSWSAGFAVCCGIFPLFMVEYWSRRWFPPWGVLASLIFCWLVVMGGCIGVIYCLSVFPVTSWPDWVQAWSFCSYPFESTYARLRVPLGSLLGALDCSLLLWSGVFYYDAWEKGLYVKQTKPFCQSVYHFVFEFLSYWFISVSFGLVLVLCVVVSNSWTVFWIAYLWALIYHAVDLLFRWEVAGLECLFWRYMHFIALMGWVVFFAIEHDPFAWEQLVPLWLMEPPIVSLEAYFHYGNRLEYLWQLGDLARVVAMHLLPINVLLLWQSLVEE